LFRFKPKFFCLFRGHASFYAAILLLFRFFAKKSICFSCFEMGLKGQSHEKVGELRVWGGSIGPN
jgi:hypothetical protein